MSHVFIETGQGGPRFGFDYRPVWLRSSKPANRFHRVPKREHDQFDIGFGLAAKHVCSAVTFDGADFGKYDVRRMLNVRLPLVLPLLAPSTFA
jgi:hypothetical protein